MAKKEFTDERLLKLNELSDIELIEQVRSASLPLKAMIDALLDMRMKAVMNSLNDSINKSSDIAHKQNWIMIVLTAVITIATLLLLRFNG